MFSKMGIGNRLIVFVISFVVLMLITISVIAISSSAAALRGQTVTQFVSKADEVARTLNLQLTNLERATQQLAQAITREDVAGDSGALRDLLSQYIRDDGDVLIHRIAVLRPNGSTAVMNIPNPLNPAEYDWRIWGVSFEGPENAQIFDPADTGDYIWLYQPTAAYDPLNQPAITLSVPLNLSDGTASVLWVDVPQSVFQSLVTEVIASQGLLSATLEGYGLLVDESNGVIASQNVSLRMTDRELSNNTSQLISQMNTTTRAPDGSTPFRTDPFNGVAVLATRHPVPIAGWSLLATLPVADIPSVPSVIIAPIIIVSVLGIGALIWLLQRFLSNAIVQPLTDISKAAQEIGSGDMRFYISHRDQNNEIGQLARALDDMRVNIDHSYQELSNWSRTLEQRVVDRTQQLDIARQQAQMTASELRAIYDESLTVVSEAQLSTILDALVNRILTLLEASYCAVWLLDEGDNTLQLVATNYDSHQSRTVIIPADQGVAGHAIQTGEPLILGDYADFAGRIFIDENRAPFVRTICVPMLYLGKPIGAIVAGRNGDAPDFSEDNLRMMTLFANLVSPAIRNAQLFVQMREAVHEAERANEVKTRFLASVTHELRTPLNLIINNMDFMRIGAFGEVTDDQVDRLNQTVRSAEHLLYLINDLLDVSKIDAGEMQLFIQPTDPYVVIEDALDTAYAVFERLETPPEQVAIQADIDENLPEIPMDTRRIRQVLTNLLSNAIKFTQEGAVTLTVKKQDDGVYFAVSDTGMGIPEDEMHLLFQAFERTRQAKEDQIEGTGLGLPISQFLIRQHGSELAVKSVVGEGSTFYFTIPYEQASPLDTAEPGGTITAMLKSQAND